MSKEKFSKKLLVEGPDDQHVVWALCEKYELPETFEVKSCGGIDELLKFLPVVHSTLEKIESEKLNKYRDIHKSKAVIHSWLAWQEDPGTPMGQSITKKYLNTDEETCSTFINWLKTLFSTSDVEISI